jgi:hypothetical protein
MDRCLVQAKQIRSYAGSRGVVGQKTAKAMTRTTRASESPLSGPQNMADSVCVPRLPICQRGYHAAADVMRNPQRRRLLVDRATTTKRTRRSFSK